MERFYTLTPWELKFEVDGYLHREDQQAELIAHLVAQHMSMFTKRPVKARDLYRARRVRGKEINYQERLRQFEQAKAAMGVERFPFNAERLRIGGR